MNIYRDIKVLPDFRNAIITLGSFDGVHRGHQRILRRISRLARQFDGESVVVTFDRHPRQVLFPGDSSLKLLTSTEEKLHYFREYGVDNVILVPFTVEFSQIGAREYVEKFLIQNLKTKCLVVGYDHRFGRDRQGDFALLKYYADRGHFSLIKIEKQEVDHIAVSSTKIRTALLQGDIRKSTSLLNHPYRISGKVIRGREIGRSLGYPTANVAPQEPAKLIPSSGVYAAFVHMDDVTFPAMLYIGSRPTFAEGNDQVSIEVHLLDFAQQIYDQLIEIDLVEFIRSDMTLDSPEALREQIRRDETQIRTCLSKYVHARKIPSAAIIVLNYNGREMFEKYLRSFNDVSYPRLDIIVADNASVDGSVEFLASHYPDVQVISLDKNYGYAGGYNRALANLDYDYYALVNSDVELTPHWLTRIVSFMEAEHGIAACQPSIRSDRERDHFEYAGAGGGFMDILGYPFCAGRILDTIEKDSGQYDDIRDITWASGAAFVVRGELFHLIGGFDASYFAHQEEIDLCLTLQRLGHRVCVVPESVVYHLGGGTLEYQSPGKVFLNFRNNLVTITKHFNVGWLPFVLLIRLGLDLSACLHYILRRQFGCGWAVVRAYAGFLQRLPATLRKRLRNARTIRKYAIGPSKLKLYKGSILIDYYLLGRRTYSQISTRIHGRTSGSGNTAS